MAKTFRVSIDELMGYCPNSIEATKDLVPQLRAQLEAEPAITTIMRRGTILFSNNTNLGLQSRELQRALLPYVQERDREGKAAYRFEGMYQSIVPMLSLFDVR